MLPGQVTLYQIGDSSLWDDVESVAIVTLTTASLAEQLCPPLQINKKCVAAFEQYIASPYVCVQTGPCLYSKL